MPARALPARPHRLLAALALAAPLSWSAPAMAYDEPSHEVVQIHAAFELRRYAPMLVAQTAMPGGREADGDVAFRRLFGYITGQNRERQALEMTVPVVMGPAAPQAVGRTDPVLTQPGEGDASPVATMQFVLPSRWTLATAPQPLDAAVQLRAVPEQWLAVRRYPGRVTEANFRVAADALLQALPAAGLVPAGAPRMAVYDGPFTPWFLRRNEALVPVEPPAQR